MTKSQQFVGGFQLRGVTGDRVQTISLVAISVSASIIRRREYSHWSAPC